jgi:GrpB-like predicted nucleotidyltransferase (UPF0157 family)
MTRKVELASYNPEWADMFLTEAEVLGDVFGDKLVAIHHIGSTAIPGILAKPILDFLVEVPDIREVDDLNSEMEALGYQPRGEYGIPGRRYFVKQSGETHTHHIHIFQTGDPRVERHLNFRSCLIAHPQEAQAYSALKEKLAQQFPEDIDSYVEGKTHFIQDIDIKARIWNRHQL